MHILFEDVINVSDIDMTEQTLHKLVLDFESLYGHANVYFNVLIHLTTVTISSWNACEFC